MKSNDCNISDIIFIGSGISTSFSLIALLDSIYENKNSNKNYTITIIEKNEEFHTGIAYGPRSGNSSLLITSLADFLPEGKYRQEFTNWLSTHKSSLIELLLESGGELSQNWVKVHDEDISNNNWEHIYIPRRFFGLFIKDKVETAIKRVSQNHNAKVNFITGEAYDIEQKGDLYHVLLVNQKLKLLTKKVVISIGMPPFKKPWSEIENLSQLNAPVLISNPYTPSLTSNLKRIEHFLANKNETCNLLIIGSNASAMEMIYKTHDNDKIKTKINKIIVVSPQGELPNSAPDEDFSEIKFIPEHLKNLQSKKQLKAVEIYNAAISDLNYAETLGYGTAITETPVSKAFISLLPKLNTKELKEFSYHYGHEIGKRQRRAGSHYTNVVDCLKIKNKLISVKGYFQEFKTKNNTTYFNYKDIDTKSIKTFNEPVHIILNCIGSKPLDDKNVSSLIDNLIMKGFCSPNPSKRGFKVNNAFQSAPNMYIMGPMLAGNLINNQAFWHIEHCGRIINLSSILANHLIHAELIKV